MLNCAQLSSEYNRGNARTRLFDAARAASIDTSSLNKFAVAQFVQMLTVVLMVDAQSSLQWRGSGVGVCLRPHAESFEDQGWSSPLRLHSVGASQISVSLSRCDTNRQQPHLMIRALHRLQRPFAVHHRRRTTMSSADAPNALLQFDAIAAKLKGRQLLCFLDYDGTLTPIVSNPQDARITPHMRSIVEKLSHLYPTAIVTGRAIPVITDFLSLPALHYAGSHGFDIRQPQYEKLKSVADDYVPQLQAFRDAVRDKCATIQGSLVEDSTYSIAVHYRNASLEDQTLIAQIVKECLAPLEDKLQKLDGKMVFEIRPRVNWHKGEAVRFLLPHMTPNHNSSDAASATPIDKSQIVPICLGDDTTDEDAFRVLKEFPHSVSVFVRAPEKARATDAKYTLNSVDQVGEFLQRIVDLGSVVNGHQSNGQSHV